MAKVKVEYVGLKPAETDHLYGTGITWVGLGDVHDVSAEAWEGMQNHPDVWKLVESDSGLTRAPAPVPVPVPAPPAPPAAPKAVWALRYDGPTLEEFVAAGFDATDYPPPGYAVRVAEAPPPVEQHTPAPAPADPPADPPVEQPPVMKPVLPTLKQAEAALQAMNDDDVIALGVEKGLGKNTKPDNMRRKLAVILSTPQDGG